MWTRVSRSAVFPARRDWRPLAIGGLALLLLAQVLIDGDAANILAALLVFGASSLTLWYSARSEVWMRAPLSALMIVGFNVTTQSGALLVQTLTARSLIYNLRVPIETFGTLALAQLVIVLIHALYLHGPGFLRLRDVVARRIYAPAGLLATPTEAQLWIVGFAGCASVWIANVGRYGASAVAFGDAAMKLFQGFSPFIMAPLLIPFLRYGSEASGARRTNWLALGLYFGLLVFLGIARNSRATFYSALTSTALILAVYIFARTIPLTRQLKLRLMAVLLLMIPAMALLSDLAIAMLNVRSERYRASGVELVMSTLSALGDREAINARRERDTMAVSGYNEAYFLSPVVGRLIVTKYHDNVMYVAVNATPSVAESGRRDFAAKLILTLPTPLLERFGIDMDKRRYMYSTGDLYLSMVEDRERGSFVVGSAIADAIIITGWLWAVVVAGVAVASFVLLDAFCIRRSKALVAIAPVGALSAYVAFAQIITAESVAAQVTWLLRALPQLALLYLIMFHATRIFGRSVAREVPRR